MSCQSFAGLAGLILVDTGARLRLDPEILDFARRAAAGEQMQPSDPRWPYAKSTLDRVIESGTRFNNNKPILFSGGLIAIATPAIRFQ